MAYFGTDVVYPTLEQICDVNRRMIERSNGWFVPPNNLFNQNALEYILTDIINPDLDPGNHLTLKDIAAKISHRIIARHVFHDGNKRTGTHIAWEFLRANGVSVYLDSSIIDLTDSIARGEGTVNDLYSWLKEHQEPQT